MKSGFSVNQPLKCVPWWHCYEPSVLLTASVVLRISDNLAEGGAGAAHTLQFADPVHSHEWFVELVGDGRRPFQHHSSLGAVGQSDDCWLPTSKARGLLQIQRHAVSAKRVVIFHYRLTRTYIDSMVSA